LDTGFHVCAKTWRLYKSRVKETRSWLDQTSQPIPQPQGSDTDGHGTQCATAFLRCAPDTCELFVARVFDDRKHEDQQHEDQEQEAMSRLDRRSDASRISQVCFKVYKM
jgi:hypothetical protein